jgi:hypothetical protein
LCNFVAYIKRIVVEPDCSYPMSFLTFRKYKAGKIR